MKKKQGRIMRIRLKETLIEEGCPICNIKAREEARSLKHLLYEMVNDPNTRKKLRDSLGFCKWHSLMLEKMIEKNIVVDRLGITIIYKDILEYYLKILEKENGNFTRGECIICNLGKTVEQDYLIELYQWIIEDCESFLEEYNRGKAIFCHKHYLLLNKKLKNNECKRKLYLIQKSKIEKIIRKMEAYINKSRYDSLRKPDISESAAYLKAIEIVNGSKLKDFKTSNFSF